MGKPDGSINESTEVNVVSSVDSNLDNVKFSQADNSMGYRNTGLFTINSKVEPEYILPTAFKTVSHNIDSSVSNLEPEAVGTTKFQDVTWHSDDINKVADDLDGNMIVGLTNHQVDQRLNQYGTNTQTKPSNNLVWRVFFYFFGGFGPLLFIGGILVVICWKPLGDPPQTANLALGLILLSVFIIQATLNFMQDFSSNQVMKSINNMLPLNAKVIRNGTITNVLSEDLVPGDVILIEQNTKIAADIRIFKLSNLVFDRSILTGETIPCPGKIISSNPNYLESESIAMQGTYCISGEGMGIVVSTGDHTIFGEIAKLSSTPKKELTTLQKELFRFIGIVIVVIIFIIVLILILWGAWIKKKYPEWINTPTLIVDLVSVAVAFIPEGLPIALAVCLIITAHKMKQSKIICKSLNIVETLGSVSVLCSDKTGTITTGKMTVTNYYGDLDSISLISRLCSEAEIKDGEVTGGNQTDRSILQYFLNSEPKKSIETSFDNFDSDTSTYQLVKHLSFSSKLKYMVKVYKRKSGDYLLTIKGAPDVLLSKIKYVRLDSQLVGLNEGIEDQIISNQLNWSNNGERVILLGSKILKQFNENDDTINIEDITFEGLIGLSDPLRDKIPEVISQLQIAGIKLVMITGDFEITAKSIARKCGIITHQQVDSINQMTNDSDGKSVVINGPDMYRLSVVDWDKLIGYNEIVFSRTTPEQKLKIVKEFQKRKHIVGMTGDGVNDSPSIKQADVGISMADGSEIAKEACDLILLDSFASMVDALLYGRLVFENVKKTIFYLLPAGSYSELWAVLLNVLGGFPQMLSSFYMIIICCITDGIASMIISFEKPERNLLNKKPRCISGEKLVDWKLMIHSYIILGTFYSFTAMLLSFLHFTRNGVSFSSLKKYGNYDDPDKVENLLQSASSIYFIILVILQSFNLLVVRSRFVSLFHTLNFRLLVILPIFASTFIWTNIPSVQKGIASSSVPVEYYFIAVGCGVLVVVYDELRKLIIRTYPKSFVAKISW